MELMVCDQIFQFKAIQTKNYNELLNTGSPSTYLHNISIKMLKLAETTNLLQCSNTIKDPVLENITYQIISTSTTNVNVSSARVAKTISSTICSSAHSCFVDSCRLVVEIMLVIMYYVTNKPIFCHCVCVGCARKLRKTYLNTYLLLFVITTYLIPSLFNYYNLCKTFLFLCFAIINIKFFSNNFLYLIPTYELFVLNIFLITNIRFAISNYIFASRHVIQKNPYYNV